MQTLDSRVLQYPTVMSWFFGRRKDGDEESSEYSSEEETLSGEEEEQEEEEESDDEDDEHSEKDSHAEEDAVVVDNDQKAKATETLEETPTTREAVNGEKEPEEDLLLPSEETPNETVSSTEEVNESQQEAAEETKISEKENNDTSAVDVAQETSSIATSEDKIDQAVDAKPDKAKSQADNEAVETQQKETSASASTTAKDVEEEKEEEEEVTSTHEKRSLLVLAAEHDRVDIMKAILTDEAEDKEELLNSSIPPLHIAIAYGSTNAVQSLVRMGADPSVRPDVKKIKSEVGEGEQLVDIPNMGRFDGRSAWELAFGLPEKEGEEKKQVKRKGSWFGGGYNKKTNLDIAPSKLEGIRHAFTAEALRCIGSDEVDRMKQLLESGMPATVDIGGKDLYEWAVEMGSPKCTELLQPGHKKPVGETKESKNENSVSEQEQAESTGTGTAVLDRSRPGTETLPQLSNRIDELESLAKALSICLDNLAEEVSVCHGLLLMGGGASALASHVRSLKTLKENKMAELERLEEAWEQGEDELQYWMEQLGDQGKEIADMMSPAALLPSDNEKESAVPFSGTSEEEQTQKHQLRAQAAALEYKVRKLRASITDLSEENTRDLEEVEKRGLSGGIKLVRTLRDEIREIEFTLNETRNAEALCRAKIQWVQNKLGAKQKANGGHPATASNAESVYSSVPPTATPALREQKDSNIPTKEEISKSVEAAGGSVAKVAPIDDVGTKSQQLSAPKASSKQQDTKPSEHIASGQSTAIALKDEHKSGYFTVDLWKILLRIIGLAPASPRPRTPSNAAPISPPSNNSNVMIV